MQRPRMRSVVLSTIGIVLVSQLITISHDNPPIVSDVKAPSGVQSILKRSCYDCHSHETVWPWYTYVAPFSWLTGHDVHDGRRKLNFSTWSAAPATGRQKQMRELVEDVKDGDMPPWYYTPMHPAARLDPQDVSVLVEWAKSQAIP